MREEVLQYSAICKCIIDDRFIKFKVMKYGLSTKNGVLHMTVEGETGTFPNKYHLYFKY